MPKGMEGSQASSSSLPEESSASSVIRLQRATAGVMLKGGKILQGNTLYLLCSAKSALQKIKSHRVRKHRAWEQESNPGFKDNSYLLCTTRGKKCISNPEGSCQTQVLTCWVLLQL